jgi:hypothetical protein
MNAKWKDLGSFWRYIPDQPVGMNIWKCEGCPNRWRQASKTGHVLFAATAAVPAGAAGLAGVVSIAPTVGALLQAGYVQTVYVVPAAPAVVKVMLSWARNAGTTNGLLFKLGQGARSLYCNSGGTCNSFNQFPIKQLF